MSLPAFQSVPEQRTTSDRSTFDNPAFMETFAPLPNWLLEQGISLGAKVVYARLCQYAGTDGVCIPGVGTLAKAIHISERQAARYLDELSDNNLIIRKRRGSNQTNSYEFPKHEWMPKRKNSKHVKKINNINELPHMTAQELPQTAVPSFNTKALKENNCPQNPQPTIPSAEPVEKVVVPLCESEPAATPKAEAEKIIPLPNKSQLDQLIETVKPDVTRSSKLRKLLTKGLSEHGYDYCEKNILYVNERSTSNYLGYLNMALKENYADEWTSPREKAEARRKAEQKKQRREAEKRAKEQTEAARIEQERKHMDSCRDKFISLPDADQETLRKEFFNSPDINFFKKKEAGRKTDISESPSFILWLMESEKL